MMKKMLKLIPWLTNSNKLVKSQTKKTSKEKQPFKLSWRMAASPRKIGNAFLLNSMNSKSWLKSSNIEKQKTKTLACRKHCAVEDRENREL